MQELSKFHLTKLHLVIYADFEPALMNVIGPPTNHYRSSTTTLQKHEATSHCFFVCKTLPPERIIVVPLEHQIFRGTNAVAKFLEQHEEVIRAINKIYKDIVNMNLTPQEEEAY
jgi:hypothetical protein